MLGKTLGHYEILEPLGAGGMGEVYRARDTKLDRDVAIKVLPEEYASDPERLGRGRRHDHWRVLRHQPELHRRATSNDPTAAMTGGNGRQRSGGYRNQTRAKPC